MLKSITSKWCTILCVQDEIIKFVSAKLYFVKVLIRINKASDVGRKLQTHCVAQTNIRGPAPSHKGTPFAANKSFSLFLFLITYNIIVHALIFVPISTKHHKAFHFSPQFAIWEQSLNWFIFPWFSKNNCSSRKLLSRIGWISDVFLNSFAFLLSQRLVVCFSFASSWDWFQIRETCPSLLPRYHKEVFRTLVCLH